MAKIIGPSVAPRVEPRISARPLPRSLVNVYALSEGAFRKLAQELERDGRFKALQERGLLERVALKGRIPQHKYEEYMDGKMVDFLNENGILEHPDWQQDFLEPRALSKKKHLAEKYGVSVGKLLPILRYFSYLRALGTAERHLPVNLDSQSSDFLEFTQSAEEVFDTSNTFERIREFIDEHEISMEQFQQLFLVGEASENDIVEATSASFPEIRQILALVEKVRVLNAFRMDVEKPQTSSSSQEKVKVAPIAEFSKGDTPLDVKMILLCDDLYDVKYRFNLSQESSSLLSREELEFIERLKAVNQRKNLLCRVLSLIFRYQYAFLLSGDPLDLRPLKQTQAAFELNEEEASISRIIRDKFIRLPDSRVVALKFFFRKAGDIVSFLVREYERRLIDQGKRSKPFTDKEIRAIMSSRYGLELSRRSITYHRNKASGGDNHYSRRAKLGSASAKKSFSDKEIV